MDMGGHGPRTVEGLAKTDSPGVSMEPDPDDVFEFLGV